MLRMKKSKSFYISLFNSIMQVKYGVCDLYGGERKLRYYCVMKDICMGDKKCRKN